MLRNASGCAGRRTLITTIRPVSSSRSTSSPSLPSSSASSSRPASTLARTKTVAVRPVGATAAAAAAGRGSDFPAGLLFSHSSHQRHYQRRAFATGAGGAGNNSTPPTKNFLGEPLELTPMPFNACMLDTDNMRVTDTSDFTTRMLVTVQQLRKEGKSSLWARVHALNGHLLGVLGTFGFKCHHCEPDTVVMNLWLQPGKENKVPPFATHLVGVAGGFSTLDVLYVSLLVF